ncbi:heterokaryon incompatibility protein-domain-containing protein, partial [Annulohypoxylon bovei var. microspora]
MGRNANTNTLCARCAGIDWDNIIHQAWSQPAEDTDQSSSEGSISEISVIDRSQNECFLKIKVSTLASHCSVCLFFSALAREEGRKGNKVERFEFWKEGEDSFYGAVRILNPTLCGVHDYKDPELSRSDEWSCDSAIGLAVQSVASNISGTLRKIDSSRIDITLLRNWISTCQCQHGKDCNPVESELVPSLRVIDVRTGIIEKAQPGCEYVALSYVWGSSQPPTKESQNNRSRSLLDTAPETIKDAAWLAQELGYRYIWIDRYCIPQDDPKAKQDQIQKMDLVYQQSELTIIAAAGEGPEFGLPGVGHRARDAQVSARLGRHTYLVTTEPKCDSFFKSKWITRGWTYQESVCSRRCVVFTRKEMFFQCGGMTCRETVCEAGQKNFFTAGLDDGPISLLGQKQTIWDHIAAYCRRQLSFDSDALNGILGIFRLHQMGRNPVYHLWGIPFSDNNRKSAEQSFLASLCWTPINDSEATIDFDESRRTDFPSWSWAGWKTPIRPFFNEYHGPPNLAGSVSVHLKNGSVLEFRDAFEQNIKTNEFNKLSTFLAIQCWTIKLEFNFPDWRSQAPPDDEESPHLWVWPAGKSKLDENSRAAVPVYRDGEIRHDIMSNSNGFLLGLVFENRKKLAHRTCDLQSEALPGEGIANFVMVVVKNGDCYERIGHIVLDDSEICRISSSTFQRITQSGSPINSESGGSLSSSDTGDSLDPEDDLDTDDGTGTDDDIDADDDLGTFEYFEIKEWLPSKFTWREVKI